MRILHVLFAGALLACVLAGAGRAAPGLLVGMDDDTLKWADQAESDATLAHARNLGIRAVRVTVPWRPGSTRLSLDDRIPVDQMILSTWAARFRVVLAVYGRATEAPQTNAERDAYCTFVASLLRRYPGVVDVVIWNEPNRGQFWRPQYDSAGNSVAPAQYEALLARCYDILHRARPGVNVIAASSPRGNTLPFSSAGASHSPVEFYRKMGDAYRASRRAAPIFDTVGHNPYPSTNSERPWEKHGGGMIGEGDYNKLMSVLTGAFGGTAQPLPGQGHVSIWYMEQGFQTAVDPAKVFLYRGTENVRDALPPWVSRSVAGNTDGEAPDQATQLADALKLAYCQPGVAALFNFEITDEPNLDGWQSGLLWTDGTPKPSYDAFKAATQSLAARNVDCRRYADLDAGAEIGFSSGPGKPLSAKQAPRKKKAPVVTIK